MTNDSEKYPKYCIRCGEELEIENGDVFYDRYSGKKHYQHVTLKCPHYNGSGLSPHDKTVVYKDFKDGER